MVGSGDARCRAPGLIAEATILDGGEFAAVCAATSVIGARVDHRRILWCSVSGDRFPASIGPLWSMLGKESRASRPWPRPVRFAGGDGRTAAVARFLDSASDVIAVGVGDGSAVGFASPAVEPSACLDLASRRCRCLTREGDMIASREPDRWVFGRRLSSGEALWLVLDPNTNLGLGFGLVRSLGAAVDLP